MSVSFGEQIARRLSAAGLGEVACRSGASPWGESVLMWRGGSADLATAAALVRSHATGLAALTPVSEGWAALSQNGETAVITTVVTAGMAVPGMGFEESAEAFWVHLYRGLGAVGREEAFTAHGHLELARLGLLDLYRAALAPGATGQGSYGGVEGLKGAQTLESLREWLVCPLQTRLQWRCAHQLAGAYEGLTLGLFGRLGLNYPWTVRNLVFARIDQVRPDRAEVSPSGAPVPAETPLHPGPAGPLRFKIKRRPTTGE